MDTQVHLTPSHPHTDAPSFSNSQNLVHIPECIINTLPLPPPSPDLTCEELRRFDELVEQKVQIVNDRDAIVIQTEDERRRYEILVECRAWHGLG